MENNKPYVWLDDTTTPMTLHVDVSSDDSRSWSFPLNAQTSSGTKLIVKCNLSGGGSFEIEDELGLSAFDPAVHNKVSVLLMSGTTVVGNVTLMV